MIEVNLADKHILHVLAGHLLGGADRYAISLAQGMKERWGWETSFACLSDGSGAEAVRACGFPVHLLGKRRRGDVRCARRLAEIISASQVDLVHSHTFGANFYTFLATTFSPRLRRVPVVHTMHGLDFAAGSDDQPMPWKMRALLLLNRATLFRVARVIVISRHALGVLLRHRYPEGKLRMIHNAVPAIEDIASLKARAANLRKALALDSAPLIGTVGRMVPVKNQQALLQAVQLLRDRGVEVNVVLLGDGVLRPRLQRYAEELQIASRVHFLGVRRDALEWISAMDVFCLPSICEGIPLVLLEALSVGTPVVASAVGGIPEVLQDGRAGVLISPGDVEGLASAIANVLAKRDETEKLNRINAGRRIVSEKFSFARFLAAVRGVYDECWHT